MSWKKPGWNKLRAGPVTGPEVAESIISSGTFRNVKCIRFRLLTEDGGVREVGGGLFCSSRLSQRN